MLCIYSLDETVLAFHNLTQLQSLTIKNCPPLAEKHLQMLTSLKTLDIDGSSITFQQVGEAVLWQLPVNRLEINGRWSGSWKEVTRLLTHLPELSHLSICGRGCEKVLTGLGLDVQQQTAASSAAKLQQQDTYRTTDPQQEIAQEVVVVDEEEREDDDDGLLLLPPAHLSYSLQELGIEDCPELVLRSHGTGLQFMGSLNTMNFLSALDLCPFPSTLQSLSLGGGMEGMETLAPLSNLTSLETLSIRDLGDAFRCDGLLPLLTQGQLTALSVSDSPKFFAGIQGPAPAQAVSKLQELVTDDIATVLTAPICRLLSSSLTKLSFHDKEVDRFSKEQEEALSLLTSLQGLKFGWCTKLRCLPAMKSLHKLTNLKRLEIWYCPAMRSLPKNGLPTSLQELEVFRCTNLRCLPEGLHKLTNLRILVLSSHEVAAKEWPSHLAARVRCPRLQK
ncbi:hypothetical protein CFC21_061777 [Triticum aestivum]|uniref:Uncharacterized protein n=2 Tax=Triticum aestivum TaxID=4565 RepID=A0A9R1GX34_WHEAT|nr:hypothetical protein CFC21_050762 [Triticum aestivum]KAF7054001.1 hypothetical protein CFC21_061777 [Triticum aestivum]